MLTGTTDAATMENIRGRNVQSGPATSPESALASELFDQFVSAGTFKSVLSTYRQLCDLLRLKPTNICSFYPRLKAKLHSWRAASLWAKLDKRASHKCYNRGKACPNIRVLLIGAGPCGLRAAIEAQLLGAKVVLVEKRDRFSRNNVLHLWPFVIHDLRNLGAKKFFGKFCAGSIDHISIRQLQIILLKVALLLGVEIHENVGFVSLLEPPEDQTQERIGWRACVDPSDHPVSQYEFDVLIGADGKRNTLLGFNRKEFRGKLAIAITANFINKHTLEEARVPEISGVAFIFNQKFFQDMREQTGIDLENIVYYKDDTHYFVMTAKKQSLLDRGVIINDYNDTARLLSAENVDREALMEYARDAADFATNYQLPSCDFAVNHYRQADVAMFDFTSMYAAENACRITERRGHKLLQGLVGDSLLEPFWPTGSGCARGFLSSFDSAWMIRSWASGKLTPLQVLAEREAIYRLLAQTTPENLSKDLNQYTLNPSSRYPNLNLHAVLPSQVRMLYNTDGKVEDQLLDIPAEIPKKKRRRESIIHPDALLNWCQRQVALHETIKIENLTSSWKNGLALCAILHRYRPDLIDISSLKPEDAAKNNQLAFDICEKELGIPPVMTGQEMSDCDIPDKLSMVSYVAQIYETFRGEIPVVCHPKSSSDDRAISPNRQSIGTPLAILAKLSNKLQNKRKYSLEKELAKEKNESFKRGRHPPLIHKRRSKERDKGIALDLVNKDVELTNFKMEISPVGPKESINSRVKNLEMKMRKDAGLRCHIIEEIDISKQSPSTRAEHTELNIKLIQEQLKKNGSDSKDKKPTGHKVGRLRKDEWNVKMLEEKICQQQKSLQKINESEKSKIQQDIFDNKLRLIEAKLQSGGALTLEEEARFKKFDSCLNKLNEHLTKGNLDAGERGHNQVAAMTEHMSTIWDKKEGCRKDPLPPPPVSSLALKSEPILQVGGSEVCYFCNKRVYLMERLSAEGLFFHRSCFKCEYCNASLRLGNYSFDKDTVCGGKFYCRPHFRMQKPDPRAQEMIKRKEAFLSCAFDEQKEKIYKTVLANAEKALSPNKQPLTSPQLDSSVTDSPTTDPSIILQENNGSRTPQELKSPNLLIEPSNNFARDQTPERVEYENIILNYSEEELLTTELEEEELTQKNLGPSQELTTSEDEYSDFSTDSESDEEAYAEELERSLTADETRKLAEQWQKKYSTEQSLVDSCASSSSGDEVSDTEIGSEDGTSDDIDSDEEYSIEEDAEQNKEKNKRNKTKESKSDLMVEVPVIDLKGLKQLSEEESTSTESDISEELSASAKGSDNETTGSDPDSDSEPEPCIPPPQIPTIVIEESPPQDIDPDQEWAENILESNEKTEIDIGNKVIDSVKNKQTFSSNVLTSETQAVFSADKIDETHLTDNFLEKKMENAIDLAINSPVGSKNDVSSVQMSANSLLSDEIVKDGDAVISSNTAVCVCDTKLNPLSDDVEKMKKDSVHEVETNKNNLSKCATSEKMCSECDIIEKNNLIGETERHEPISKGASFRIPSSLPLLNSGKLVQNVCMDPSPCTCDSSSVSSSGGWGLLKSEQSSEDSDFPLIGPEITPLSPEKDFLPNTDFNCVQNVHNFFNTNDLTEFEHTGTKETEKTSLVKSPSSPIENNIGGNLFEISDNSTSDLKTSELKNDASSIKVSSNSLCEVSMDITSVDGLNNHNSHSKDNVSLDMEIESEFYDNSKLSSWEISVNPQSPNDMNTADLCSKNNFSSDMEIESEDDHYNPAFVTIRQKNKSHHNDTFSWDSDKSISVMWFNEQDNIDDSIIDWSVKKSENLSNVSSDDNVLYETANEICSENSQNIVECNLNSTMKTPEELLNENIHNRTLNQIQDSFSDYSMPCAPNLISSPIEQILTDVDAHDITKQNNSDLHIFDKKNSCLDAFEKRNENSTLNLSEMNHNNSSTQNNSLTNDNSKMVQILSKDISIDQTSPLDNQDVSIGNTSDKGSKYRGYSGSFAEKIRPKSALGDTIYLRSLDINLQKQQFPSLAKSNDKLDDVSSEDGYQIKKKLFHSTEKLQDHQANLGKNDSISGFYKKGFQRHISIPGDNPSSTNIVKQSVMSPSLTPPATKKDNINISNVVSVSFDCSSQKPELLNKNSVTLFRKTFADPISPYTYSQVKAAKENIFPVKMRPKCDMDLTKLQAKREKRKSVHENIQGLPFADEEKAVTPIDTPTTPGNTFNPLGIDIETAAADIFPLENSSAQDKARKEARARARLKSDEELGLSPKNYRKKYQRQLSLSSIYYDELVGDEFYDHENEVLEDEIIDGTFHAKRVEISELHSEGSDTDQQSSNKVIEKIDFISNVTEAVKIERTDTRSVIDLTLEDFKSSKIFTPKTENKHMPALLTSTPNTKNSSDSPDIGFPETPPIQSKSQPNQLSENFNEEEKLKSNSKKSFFSILNFGKGHISKDKSNKNKAKDVESVRACSLPSDLSVKAPLKQKTLSNLKITKLKDKTKEKQKQKHSLIDSPEIVDSVLSKNIPTTDFVEPRSILLNSEQAKIVPKYAVYRNPGSRLTAIPQHIPMQKTENGLAPKASEDSFSDTEDDTQKHKVQNSANDMEKDDKDLSEKEKKAQRVIQKVQRQQELKRLRTAQEIQRRLEELEVQQRDLEQQGVEVEKALRGERQDLQHGGESDLMQEWYKLVHSKNRLLREEQELLIRLKELELEDRHSRLQQEMRERMAQSASQKNSNQIGEEKKILTEMLKIVEERDELVAMLDQLRLKEVEEDKTLGSKISHACGKLSNDKS